VKQVTEHAGSERVYGLFRESSWKALGEMSPVHHCASGGVGLVTGSRRDVGVAVVKVGAEEAAPAKHRQDQQLCPAHAMYSSCAAARSMRQCIVSRCIRDSVWRLATCVIIGNNIAKNLHRRAALQRSPGESSSSAVVQPCTCSLVKLPPELTRLHLLRNTTPTL
jgi:hypothetical protein